MRFEGEFSGLFFLRGVWTWAGFWRELTDRNALVFFRNETGMAPRDMWDSNPVFSNGFYYSYLENIVVNGIGYSDPYPVYTSLVDREWVDTDGDENPADDDNASFDTEAYMLEDSDTDSETDDSDDDTIDPYDVSQADYDRYMQQVLDLIVRHRPGSMLNPIDLTEEDTD